MGVRFILATASIYSCRKIEGLLKHCLCLPSEIKVLELLVCNLKRGIYRETSLRTVGLSKIDNFFHGKTYQTSSKLDIAAFPAWPNREKAKPELKSNMIGTMKMDGYKDAKRLDS